MNEVYIVRKNSDSTEGKGAQIIDSVWDNEIVATQYLAKLPGVMGVLGNHNGNDIKAYPVYSKLTDKRNLTEIKATALAKLTLEECQALGLK